MLIVIPSVMHFARRLFPYTFRNHHLKFPVCQLPLPCQLPLHNLRPPPDLPGYTYNTLRLHTAMQKLLWRKPLKCRAEPEPDPDERPNSLFSDDFPSLALSFLGPPNVTKAPSPPALLRHSKDHHRRSTCCCADY